MRTNLASGPPRGALLPFLCALLALPSLASGGMLDTPLPTFTDGKAAARVGLVPAVVKNNNLETVVICTNLDTVPVNIGFEVFDQTGAPKNSIGTGNGEILNVAVGATVSIGTASTVILTEDVKILGLPTLQNGSGRVVATARNVFCTALVADELHDIDPAFFTETPPSLVRVPVWSCGNSVVDPFEVCDDGNTADGDACNFDCTVSSCGDGDLDTGEECDDGNTVDGDGCDSNCTLTACGNGIVTTGEQCDDGGASASCNADCTLVGGLLQNLDQQRCITTLNKGLAKLALLQGRQSFKCLKLGAKGLLVGQTIDQCVADSSGRIAIVEQKNVTKAALKCTDPPDYAATDAATGNQTAKDQAKALTHDVFGPDLTSAIIPTSADLAAAKCQFLVANFVHKCFDARLKRFDRCKKRWLRGVEGPANRLLSSAEDIELCLGFDPAPRFLIAKFCNTKLLTKIQTKCPGNLDKFAGCGAPATDEDLRMCLDTFAKCRACLAVNEADALAIDCDLADDGNANSSCP